MSGLNNDPLFIGLTRPTLIFGVSTNFAMLNMIICGIYFIQTNTLSIIFVAILVHMVGYILCFKEPRFMELYIMKFSNFNKCSNKTYYGANSYYI
jgi:type IV secretion system protein VirB3